MTEPTMHISPGKDNEREVEPKFDRKPKPVTKNQTDDETVEEKESDDED